MHPLEKISTGTTREAGHQPDGTEYPAWSGQDGKNYGSERGCNSFLNVSFAPIAPQSVTREDHDGISHNLITQENYVFLRDSYFRYAGLLNVDAPHDRGKSIGEGIANLYNELAALLDETVHVNYEERNGRLYFNLWQAHTWGKYTLYYFPVKFVEALNPKLRRIALSFLHHLMSANGFSTINDEEDTNWVFEMFSQDDDGEDKKERAERHRLLHSYKEGRIYKLLDRVYRKSYYKNLPEAIDKYECRNGLEQELIALMRQGLEFVNPDKSIMSYAYDPWFDEEPDYYPKGLEQQIRVVYDCEDIMTEYLIDFYNSSRQETYDIIPITTFALSPETDKVFSREDNYPERFFRWADKFINFIY